MDCDMYALYYTEKFKKISECLILLGARAMILLGWGVGEDCINAKLYVM